MFYLNIRDTRNYLQCNTSALLDVAHFPFFDGGLPHDCMHDILEGAAPTEIKLLLKHCIAQKYFTVEEYNKSLVHFNYGYTESDRDCSKPLSK